MPLHTVIRPTDIYEDTVLHIYMVIYAEVYALREMEKLRERKLLRKPKRST